MLVGKFTNLGKVPQVREVNFNASYTPDENFS